MPESWKHTFGDNKTPYNAPGYFFKVRTSPQKCVLTPQKCVLTPQKCVLAAQAFGFENEFFPESLEHLNKKGAAPFFVSFLDEIRPRKVLLRA
jgi:hypothetical protein